MSRKLIALIVVIVAVVGLAVAGFAVLNSPKIVAARALKNAVTDFTERDEIKPLLNTFKRGSAEFSIDNVKQDGELLFDGKASGKIYFSKHKKSLMLNDFALKYGELALEGEVYISDEEIYIYETKLLKGHYGVNFDQFADDLANSILAPSSGSAYALDEELYDNITTTLKNSEENKDLAKDAKKLVEKVTNDIKKIIISNAEIDSQFTKERINGNKEKVRVITVTVDDAAMQNIVLDIYDYLCDSDDIVDFIDKYEDTFAPIVENMLDLEDYDSLSEAYLEWLEEAEDTVDDFCDSLEDADTVEIKIMTPKRSAKLLKVELTVDGDSVVSVDFGKKGVKNTDTIKFEYGDSSITYSITENNSKKTEATLSTHNGRYTTNKFTLSIDHKSDKYTLTHVDTFKSSYSNYETTYTTIFKGTLVTKGITTNLTVDSITSKYANGTNKSETVTKLNCSVTLKTIDRMPKPLDGYKTIADITESQVNTWIEKFSKFDF